jgi:hypothetical protein
MADVFTLEALEAKYGDSLLLHYGDAADPRLIVIDGGPAAVYGETLRPRLDQIQQKRGGGQLEIRMLMVSHIDLDHINGVLKLTQAMRKDQEDGRQLPFDILTLWHNSFDDLVGSAGASALQAGGAAAAFGDVGAIVAGVAEGRRLRQDADALAINMNSGFDDLIQFDTAAKPLRIGGKLSFTVVGPRKTELDKLKEDWKKKLGPILEKEKQKEAAKEEAAKPDTSIPNLSSIVVLAEFGDPGKTKTMLLTGDARGGYIVKSLTDAGKLANGPLKVDILKLPHHGSARNCTPDLFASVLADHYVVSANGQNDNPDLETFDNLFAARPGGGYTIWLTNDVANAVAHIKAKRPAGVGLEIRHEDPPNKKDVSVKIELADKITW